jgi:hypothetical protein
MGDRTLRRAPSSESSFTIQSRRHVPSMPIKRADRPCSNLTLFASEMAFPGSGDSTSFRAICIAPASLKFRIATFSRRYFARLF